MADIDRLIKKIKKLINEKYHGRIVIKFRDGIVNPIFERRPTEKL